MANANATAGTKPRIGFIGVGLMGHGIAKNLVTKGFPLAVCMHLNRKPKYVASFIEAQEKLTGLKIVPRG